MFGSKLTDLCAGGRSISRSTDEDFFFLRLDNDLNCRTRKMAARDDEAEDGVEGEEAAIKNINYYPL